jgi:NAD(P)-dependent dehydrogenase (short-subunit alcohol dehydrogenase family)
VTIAGKTVVVTGGGSGIGRAMVEQFAAAGARVVAIDVVEQRLDSLRAAVPDVVTATVDLADDGAPDAIVEAAGRPIDVLNNNAGILDGLALVDETTDELWNRVFSINVAAPFRLCRLLLPSMVARGGGVITNTASVAGLSGGRGGAAYTASKFALVGLTKNIAATYGTQGIRCNALCPGSTATEIASDMNLSERGFANATRFASDIGSAERIASVAVFLATEEASRINGAAIPVDDGWIAY